MVRSATGRDSDIPTPGSWDVTEFAGHTAQLELVGHVNVDEVVQTDHPDVPPVTTQPLYGETWRPQYHFTARQFVMDRLNPGMRQEGWLNDLNGLVYYEGSTTCSPSAGTSAGSMPSATTWCIGPSCRRRSSRRSLDTAVQSGSVVDRLRQHIRPVGRSGHAADGRVLVAQRQPESVPVLQPRQGTNLAALRQAIRS